MSPPTENSLQSEATTVERLRREIAGLPARGQVASPQLLAEFARAQKSYLDKKIEFEKQRRAPDVDHATQPPAKVMPEGVSGRDHEILPPIGGVVSTDKPFSAKKGVRFAIIALLVAVGLALLAWFLAF